MIIVSPLRLNLSDNLYVAYTLFSSYFIQLTICRGNKNIYYDVILVVRHTH